jgi:predicted ATPase
MATQSRYKARLRSLELTGWKSIKRLDPRLEFGRINVLIGANGVGKSNLVTFFKMLNELIGNRLQEFIGRSGGAESLLHLGVKQTPMVEAILEFDSKDGLNRYYMRLVHAAADTLIFSDERLEFRRTGRKHWITKSLGAGQRESQLDAEADKERLQAQANQSIGWMATVTRLLLTYCRVFHFHDTSDTARVRQSCYIESNRHLLPDAGNLAAMLYRYQKQEPSTYRRIVETIRLIVPFFEDFIRVVP